MFTDSVVKKFAKIVLGWPLCVLLFILLINHSPFLWAQTATGSIAGTVTDPSGAAIAGAKVELVNANTNESRKAATSERGYYSFTLLPPGEYRINVTATGFKQFQQLKLQVDVGIALTSNASLQVGNVSQVVNVTANQEVLESQSSSLGQVIDTHEVDDLPLNGRNSYSFTTLVPGIIAPYGFTQTAFDEYNDQFISINGSRPNASLFLLDGGNNSEPGFNGPGVYPSVDLVQEYKVMTNNFSAEFTNTAGGVINVVTKAGANQLHGSGYEFFRDTGLSANNFFANEAGLARSPFKFNQFGASLGGPIKKDKTFFFFSYEGIRWTQGVTMVATLPTAAQRAGDFSQTNDAAGQVIPIFNPFTTMPDPANPGNYVRQQFQGNMIPSSMIDPTAQALLNFLPLPNGPGAPGTGANNFTSDTDQQIIKNDFSLRIDQVLSQRQKLFARFTISDTTQTRPDLYGKAQNFVDSDPTVGNDFLRQYQGTVDYTSVLRPNLVLELNSSYVFYSLGRKLNGYGLPISDLNEPSNFSALGKSAFPTVYVSGMSTNPSLANLGSNALFGEYNDELNDPLGTYHEYGNLTLLKGSHTFKFGADFGRAEISGTDFETPGAFDYFSTNYTQGPDPINSTGSGVGFASFLLGLGSGTLDSGGSYELVHNWYYGAYLQDDWRVTPRLTLNLGVRYDMNRPLVVQGGRMTDWNPSSASPLQVSGLNLVGGAEFPGVNGVPNNAWNPNKGNLAPRVGFAFLATKNTVIRGGFGVFTAPIDGAWFNGNGLPLSGWQGVTPWVTSLDGVTPLNNTLSNQFPGGFIFPTGSSLGLLTQVGQGLTAMNRHRPSSYAEQWNVDVQRHLPGDILLDVAYTGSRGIHLFGDYDNNQLPDSDLALGSQLLTQVSNPFYGSISSGPLSSPTVAMSQLLLPYPQFTSVVLGNGSAYGQSSYNAFNLKVSKRFSHGFSFLGSYSWSRLMDNLPASETGFPGGSYADEVYGGGGGIQDYHNLRAERSFATFDTPNSLAINGIWELPFGRKRRFLSDENKALDYLVGGWQVNAISIFQSGTPMEIYPVTNTLYNNGGVQRADWNGQNPRMSGSTSQKLNEYFNVSDFSAPAAFTYGNTPRTLGFLRTPGVANFDMSAVKDFYIREGMKIQFRVEAFNIFNRVQFGAPDGILGDGTTGVISTQTNLPREIQLAAKFEF